VRLSLFFCHDNGAAMTERKTRYCHCNNERVSVWDCDGCPGDWIDYDNYVEPPLYRTGQLAGMTPEALILERDRQHRIHDSAVDRCEEINSPTIETAAARANMVQNELKRRGLNPYADTPELVK
jgi:hypothetical protein